MKPQITFIATAHNEKWHQCAFTSSMLNQTCQEFSAIVYHNGPSENMRDEHLGLPNIKYIESSTDTGNWGTVNRQQAILECTTDYIIQTSIQDYWLPQAVQTIVDILQQKPDMVIWNSINHVVGPCLVLDSQLAWGKIDWGNFAIRTDIARVVGINHGTQYCGDWGFVQDVLNSGLVDMNKVIKTNAVLTCHN